MPDCITKSSNRGGGGVNSLFSGKTLHHVSITMAKLCVAFQISGWFSLIQRIEQKEEHPETGKLQVSRRNVSSPINCRISLACLWDQPSNIRVAGPSAFPSSSIGTRPGVVTESETIPTFGRNSFISTQQSLSTCHHYSGSISAFP